MNSLGIGRRLQVLAVVAITSLLVLAVSGAYVASHLRSSVNYVYTNALPSVESIDAISQDFLRLRLTVLYHFLNKEVAKKESAEEQINNLKEKIRSGVSRFEKELVSDAKDKEMLDKEKALFEAYFVDIQPALERSRARDDEGVTAAVANATRNMTVLAESLEAHKRYNQTLAEDYIKAAESTDQRGTTIAIVLVLFSLCAVGGLSFFLIREIRGRMNRLSELMNQVADTLDFTKRINITRMDELGKSGDAFNKLLDKMQSNLKSIANGAESVAAAANEMATTSEKVATASHQQSESASNMAATVEEMTVSVNHVADRAQETSRLANDSGRLASEGEEVIDETAREIQNISTTVNEASALMRGLEENSREISSIVHVIKEVADQTNLLALNAAIEAARAGEHGRGFAIVADEVRKLAERTASSTQEISETINKMLESSGEAVTSMEVVVNKVSLGVEKARSANDSMRQIGEGARGSLGMVEEIAEAIREQGAATNNIALQVEKIAQMSEESSAAAEHGADAAKKLDNLASGMSQILATYKL